MNKFFLSVKILAMVGLLITVIMSIRYFKSDDFILKLEAPGSGPALFFGFEQRMLSWCTEDTQQVEFIYPNTTMIESSESLSEVVDFTEEDSRIMKTPEQLAKVCKIKIESITAESIGSPKDYRVVALIRNKNNRIKYLKKNFQTGVYIFEGLPFQSKHLNLVLKDFWKNHAATTANLFSE